MRKFSSYILATLICFSILYIFIPEAKAINPIDPQKPSSLSLCYKNGEDVFEGAEIKIYRISSVDEKGIYTLVSPFDQYNVNIYGITSQTEWDEICSTLYSYIIADDISASYTSTTDKNGIAFFDEIETGMYLIERKNFDMNDKTISFGAFLTVLPRPDENGDHNYNLEIFPKSQTIIPTPDTKEYRIIKQWKDTGFEEKRPENVYVDIYRNGVFFETKTLNSENNWVYKWNSENGITWTAVERNVPKEYTVTFTENGNTIIITNAYNGEEPTPGKPGDDGSFWKYTLLAFISGVILISIALKLKETKE